MSLPEHEPFADVKLTHSGVIILLGERAWKLKRPVDLGVVDFRDVENRRRACAREIELNRRLAPDVYLGMGTLEGLATPAEPAVIMRRLPASYCLQNRLHEGTTMGEVGKVARVLATLHEQSPRNAAISDAGSRNALRNRWDTNFRQVRKYDRMIDRSTVDKIAFLVDEFLEGRGPLFQKRIDDGCVVDGHGDLMASDVFLLPDGPRLLDCLEFDDQLRYLDRLDDIAFLAMDLERLGAPRLTSELIRFYFELTHESAPDTLLHHYMAYRAFVRARVACLPHGRDDQPSVAEACSYVGSTLQHLQEGRVHLILVGGPPGTGKTTVSLDLAERLGFYVLSSDWVRKELAGLDPRGDAHDHYGRGIYSASWTDRTYEELLRRAERLMGLGESVILDATWTTFSHRAQAMELSKRCHAVATAFQCDIDEDTAARRLVNRTGMSDANQWVATALRRKMAPWPASQRLDTSERREVVLAKACSRIWASKGAGFGDVHPSSGHFHHRAR